MDSKMAAAEPVRCQCKTNACTRVRGRAKENTRGYCPCRENGTACTYLCECGKGKYACANTDYIEEEEEIPEDDLHDPLYQCDEGEADGETVAVFYGAEEVIVNSADILNDSLQNLAEEQAELNASMMISDDDEEPTVTKSKKKSAKVQRAKEARGEKKSDKVDRATEAKQKKKSADARRKADIERITSQVSQLSTDGVQTLALKLVQLYPDLVEMAMGPYPPEPPQNTPSPGWCNCFRCREMPTAIERVCCIPSKNKPCKLVEDAGPINQLVLSRTALEVAVLNHNEYCIQDDDPTDHDTLRHMAYRKFVLWRRGYLGPGVRVVIPSCMVWAIRDKYPSVDGTYTGYKPLIY